jgi:4-amino-4-deoxy-L-arabinose transferase-like glycosyltransferase
MLPLLLGLLLRGGVLLGRGTGPQTTTDSPTYFAMAANLIEGNGFSTDSAPPYGPSTERPPTYPLFIAFVWGIFGKGLTALGVAQILLDVAAILLIYLTARMRVGERAALVAAIIYAILPFPIGTSLQFMSEGVAGACVALAAYAQTRAIQKEATVPGWAAVTGFAWGAAALARPYLAVGAAAAAVVLWIELRQRARTHLRAAVAFAVVGVLSVGTIAPWTIRNAWVSKTTGAPFVLFQPYGSREPFISMYTDGFLAWYRSYEEPVVWLDSMKPPRANYFSQAEEDEVRALWEKIKEGKGRVTPEMNAAFQRIADERYAQAPLRMYVWRPLSIALKYWFSPRVSTFQLSMEENGNAGVASRTMTISFFFLNVSFVVLAFIGVISRVRSRDHWFLWVVPIGITAALAIVAQRESRLVMPLFPIVSIAAGVGLLALLARVAPRVRRILSPGAAAEADSTPGRS